MQYLLLAVTTVCLSAQQLIQKRYNQKTENPNQFLFLAFTALAATVFFIAASLFRLSFDPAVLPYSLGFATAYIAATVGLIYALKLGSMAITALVNSYSLLIPTFYGIIFLRESVKVAGIIGIALLLVSLFLLGAKKRTRDGRRKVARIPHRGVCWQRHVFDRAENSANKHGRRVQKRVYDFRFDRGVRRVRGVSARSRQRKKQPSAVRRVRLAQRRFQRRGQLPRADPDRAYPELGSLPMYFRGRHSSQPFHCAVPL